VRYTGSQLGVTEALYGAIFGGVGLARLQFAAPAQPEIDILEPATRSLQRKTRA